MIVAACGRAIFVLGGDNGDINLWQGHDAQHVVHHQLNDTSEASCVSLAAGLAKFRKRKTTQPTIVGHAFRKGEVMDKEESSLWTYYDDNDQREAIFAGM
eukprot:489205-Pelagomonas_calceolata.AAC.1